MFAHAFLVWITAVTPERYMGTAVRMVLVGPNRWTAQLGSALASYSVPWLAHTRRSASLSPWRRRAGSINLLGVREKHGMVPLSTTGHNPVRLLLSSVSVVWRRPRWASAALLPPSPPHRSSDSWFLSIFFTRVVGFTLQQWLQVPEHHVRYQCCRQPHLGLGRRSHRLAPNHHVHRRVRMRRHDAGLVLRAGRIRRKLCACGYRRHGLWHGPGRFCSIGAIMATLAPESRGAAMSIMNLGSGISTFIGSAVAGVFLPILGVSGVIWIFGIYVRCRSRNQLYVTASRG